MPKDLRSLSGNLYWPVLCFKIALVWLCPLSSQLRVKGTGRGTFPPGPGGGGLLGCLGLTNVLGAIGRQ